ncbi:MAG: ATP-binding protein, partial [Chitinophagales bacterium]
VNINEQKQAFDNLEQSERTQQAILEALPDLTLKISRNGEYLAAYPARDETEYKPNLDIIGKNVKDIMSPKIYPFIDRKVTEAFEKNKVISFDVDAVVNEKELTLHSSVSPIDEDSYIAVIRNITERISAQQTLNDKINELQKSEQIQQAILGAMPDLILKINRKGEYLAAFPSNSDEGYNPEVDIIGKTIKEVLPQENVDIVYTKMDEAFSKEKIIFFDMNRYIDEIKYNLNVCISPIDDETAIIVIRNITDRIKIRQNLDDKISELEHYIEKNTELERYAYIVSHDLKEPLRSIKSFTEILATKYRDNFDEHGQKILDFITSGAERMNNLIEGILSFSKIEENNTPFEEVCTHELVTTVLQDLNNITNTKNAVVNTSDLPVINCNKLQIRQVFQNLTNNAIKFCEDKPIININCESKGDFWQFSIQDNGIGINIENKDSIFQMFRRLNKRGKYSGQGLGLSICKKIIERHEGEIWVKSELGEGTTFFFTIPKNSLD